MRLLFSANAELGHVLPLLPLASAARVAGHEVVMLSSAGMAAAVEPVPVVGVGPEWSDLVAENVRRHPAGWGSGDGSTVGAAEAAELYAGTRLEMTVDDAMAAARGFAPDAVVAEPVDYVGPMVAAALEVPWAMHALGPALPHVFVEVLEGPLPAAYAARGLGRSERIAYLDPCPEFLQPPDWVAPSDRIAMRPRPHANDGGPWTPPRFPGREERPLVLLTLGTMIGDPSVYYRMLDAIGVLDVNVVVTWAPCGDPSDADVDRSWVHPVGFVALEQLLEHVTIVVTPGGSGTVLGSLAAGRPLVLLPMFADHRGNAERAAATGSAVVAPTTDALADALRAALSDPSYTRAAVAVAQRVKAIATTEQVLANLTEILDRPGPAADEKGNPPTRT